MGHLSHPLPIAAELLDSPDEVEGRVTIVSVLEQVFDLQVYVPVVQGPDDHSADEIQCTAFSPHAEVACETPSDFDFGVRGYEALHGVANEGEEDGIRPVLRSLGRALALLHPLAVVRVVVRLA